MNQPAILTSARLNTIQDDSIALWNGKRDGLDYVIDPTQFVPISGTWTLESSGLYVSCNGGGQVVLFPFDVLDNYDISGWKLLVYPESAAMTVDVIQIAHSTATLSQVASSNVNSAGADAWETVVKAALNYATTGDATYYLRVTSGANGDRIGAGVITLACTP